MSDEIDGDELFEPGDAQPEQPATPRRVNILARQQMALDLRKQGGNYRQIADTLKGTFGISKRYDFTQAHKDVKAALRQLIHETAVDAEELRQLIHEQLMELFAVYYPRAIDRLDYMAFDRVLGILDRLANLYGLNKINVGIEGLLKNFDISKLNVEQLDRVISGEDLMKVLLDAQLNPNKGDGGEGAA